VAQGFDPASSTIRSISIDPAAKAFVRLDAALTIAFRNGSAAMSGDDALAGLRCARLLARAGPAKWFRKGRRFRREIKARYLLSASGAAATSRSGRRHPTRAG